MIVTYDSYKYGTTILQMINVFVMITTWTMMKTSIFYASNAPACLYPNNLTHRLQQTNSLFSTSTLDSWSFQRMYQQKSQKLVQHLQSCKEQCDGLQAVMNPKGHSLSLRTCDMIYMTRLGTEHQHVQQKSLSLHPHFEKTESRTTADTSTAIFRISISVP